MRIRKGTIKDVNEILQVLITAPELQGGNGSSVYKKSYVKEFILDKKKHLVLIAEENKKMAGFLTAEIWKKKEFSFLVELYIFPDFRKQGLAQKLIKELENYCKKHKIKRVALLVQQTNQRMQNLQNKLGYNQGHLMYYYEKELQ